MDLSFVLLELALNSLDAGATLVKATLKVGRRATLKVKDNGAGMDRETLSRACEKGFSLKGSGGIGLYQVSAAAEEYGGKFSIRSRKGKGTTATFKAKGINMGDVAKTVAVLLSDGANLILKAKAGKNSVFVDAKRFANELGAPLNEPATIVAIKRYINENLK